MVFTAKQFVYLSEVWTVELVRIESDPIGTTVWIVNFVATDGARLEARLTTEPVALTDHELSQALRESLSVSSASGNAVQSHEQREEHKRPMIDSGALRPCLN